VEFLVAFVIIALVAVVAMWLMLRRRPPAIRLLTIRGIGLIPGMRAAACRASPRHQAPAWALRAAVAGAACTI
jgi:hypothetical protein